MRLKTLAVFIVSALSLFGLFYWITDNARRENRDVAIEESLLDYGQELFGPATAQAPFTANCASCHGPEGMGGPVGDTGVMAPNLHSSRIADKLTVNEYYINLVIRFGGVVVSGNVDSLMPAWSQEVGRGLNTQQIDALEALVTSWAKEAAENQPEGTPPPDTAEAGAQVFEVAGCVNCHGANLEGGVGPSLQNIGNEPVTDELPTPVAEMDKLIADYVADPRTFLEQWIRDSSNTYNGGTATGMPAYPPDQLSDEQLQALITYLLEGKQ